MTENEVLLRLRTRSYSRMTENDCSIENDCFVWQKTIVQQSSGSPHNVFIFCLVYRIRLIFRGYFISLKQAKVGFTKFSQTSMWVSSPDLLNLIFAVLYFHEWPSTHETREI